MKDTEPSTWQIVCMIPIAVVVAISSGSSAWAQTAGAVSASKITPAQMRALGLKNQQDVEDYLTIDTNSTEINELPDSWGYQRDADITLQPNAPNITWPPPGTGAGGTWNPNGGTGAGTGNGPIVVNPIQIPSGSATTSGGLNGKLQALTGLDINGWIAIGSIVSQIVVANQPVVSVTTPSLTIVPASLPNWSQMVGWSLPLSKAYNITIKNKLGGKTVDLTYRLIWNANGGLNGSGHYIANLRTLVDSLSVAWGYKVDFKSVASEVINRGTVADPIAAVSIDLNLHIHTLLKDGQLSDSFCVAGNGDISKTN